MYIILQPMKGKKDKQNLQILIHGIDEKVYKAVIKLASDEKRSVGKQAEYMLAKYLETMTQLTNQ